MPVKTAHAPLLAKVTILAIVAALAYMLYSQWGSFVAASVDWQRSLHAMLAEHMRAVAQDVFKYGAGLVALSFVYGVFHAVGPGHGKAVMVTYLGSHKQSVMKGIVISFAAAFMQALVAIALVSTLARLLKFKLADVHNYGDDMALVSYILVMLLGGLLIVGALKRLFKQRRLYQDGSTHEHDLHDHDKHHHSHAHDHHGHSHNKQAHDGDAHHEHHHDCGCTHTHVPEANESIWQTLAVIVSMGIRPCSGAIVVLIYAHLVGVYSYGIAASFMMALGTGMSVSLIAVATLYARAWLERFVSSPTAAQSQQMFSHALRLAGGVILLALGWSFYQAASALSAGHPLF